MSGPTTDGSGRHVVLCVEDVESNAQLVDRALRRIPGLHVVIAASGAEARRVLATTHCDVILTDLNLPDVSGPEWVAQLVATGRPSVTPVVVVSADATPPRIADALAAGATTYLTKPVDLRRLIALVQGLLEERGARQTVVESSDDRLPRPLVDRYVAETTADLEQLRAAAVSNRLADVERHTHRLIGSARVFGRSDLADILERLEAMARGGRLERPELLLDEADAALARFLSTLDGPPGVNDS